MSPGEDWGQGRGSMLGGNQGSFWLFPEREEEVVVAPESVGRDGCSIATLSLPGTGRICITPRGTPRPPRFAEAEYVRSVNE